MSRENVFRRIVVEEIERKQNLDKGERLRLLIMRLLVGHDEEYHCPRV